MARPAWRLAPLACQHVSAAPKPRLSVDARGALRALLEQPPLLPATALALPGASHLQGDREAHQAARSPPHPAPATLRPPPRVAAAPRSPAAPRSRVAHRAARPGATRRVEPGAEPGAPRCIPPSGNGPPTSLAARPAALRSALLRRGNVGKTLWRSAPARGGARPS